MNLKRIGCGLLAMALCLPLSFPITSYASNFPDVTGHWAEFYISKVYNEHIISGYPNGGFQPDKAVTRAEFIAMVNKTFELDRLDYEESIDFNDVNYSSWYYRDIATAVAAGYATGYNDNSFKPNSPISRQDAAVMLSRLIPAGKKNGNLKSFADTKSIAGYATDALAKMNGKGYFGAYSDKKLHPSDSLTRAQTAKILAEILDNEDIVTKKTVVDKDKTELADKIYVADVVMDEDLGKGSATIDNCIILGELKVNGGGNGTITLNNTRVVKAVINEDDSAVRLVTKGSSLVSKLEVDGYGYLQTSSKDGYGFPDITVKGGADLTMKGTFPSVSITGAEANVTLESGKISKFTVMKKGKYSDITLSGKSEITEATVDAECYFHGAGTLAYVLVNADDVTYETKPGKMVVGLDYDRPIAEGDEDVAVTFDPSSKDDDVDVDTKITVSFNTSMMLAGGKAISDSKISDFLSLHIGSKTGDKVNFKATINSAKKVITITPDAELSPETKYYVVLVDEALENAGGNLNDGKSIYFTTEESDLKPTFSPSDGSTGVALSPTVTIKFTESVVKYSDASEVTDAYLQECIQLKAGGASGSAISYTAAISSARTVTLTLSTNLTAGQTYYVGVVASKLKTKDDGHAIPASSVTWTVASAAVTPVLSNLALTPADDSVSATFTPNVAGTVYAMISTSSTAPTEAQIIAANKTVAAVANTTGTLNFTGLTANTKYYVYALLRNSSSVSSAIVTANTTTTISEAALSSLTLAPSGGSNVLTDFSTSTKTYTVTVPLGTNPGRCNGRHQCNNQCQCRDHHQQPNWDFIFRNNRYGGFDDYDNSQYLCG